MYHPRPASMLACAAIVVSCAGRTHGEIESRCPPPTGEFPPHACAIVRGRAVDPDGQPIASLGVRVDSLVRERGYAYVSGGTRTGTDGWFELTVLRVNQFATPTVPDTATIEIKALPDGVPEPGFVAAARAPVRMHFAPMGAPVEPTMAGFVVFTLP